MKQLCYHPAPICPSTDFILQLDIILPHRRGEKRRRSVRQRWGGKQNRQRKSQEEVGSTVSALTRLRRRKWKQRELGHEWDEIRGGDTGALQATTSNVWPKIGPPGRRASNLWIRCSSTAEGWEGSTFLVARDVCALRKGAPLQHVQCYIIPDALQGRSSKVPLSSHVHPHGIMYSAAVNIYLMNISPFVKVMMVRGCECIMDHELFFLNVEYV